MSSINWKDLRKNATTVLEGEFGVLIFKSEAGLSSNGKDMIKIQLKISSGPHAGRTVFHNFVVSEHPFAQKRFFEDLAVLGLDEAWFDANNPSMELIASTLLNKNAVVVLEKNTYNGTEREQVKSWKSSSGGGPSGGLSGMTAAPLAHPLASNTAPTVAEDTTAPPADPF